MNIADGYQELMRAAAQAVLPDPELKLDIWSERHVVLPKGSAFSGPYRLSHTPYARRVLQCLSPGHHASRVVVRAASQMLKTQVFINAALGWIHSAPANILALEPTDKLAKRLSSRVSKAIGACDAVRPKVARPRSRDARNTVDCKEFDGGAVYITTAGAAANLAEIPARYVFCDEVDRMEVSVNGEGDPVDLAEARTTTYEGISKAYHVSSPTVIGASKIDALHAQGTQEVYLVPCPHCGHLHELLQENFRYDYDPDTDRVERAWFVCPECGCEIEEDAKPLMLPDEEMGGQARWVAKGSGDGETVSLSINAFYAPLGSISWLRLARQHARAKVRLDRGDASAMQVYYNTRLALSWDGAQERTTAKELQDRAAVEVYQLRVIPDRALVVSIAVDTQPNRLEVQAEAWGPGLEHWVLDHQVLWGSPADAPEQAGSVWQRLDEYRRTPFAHERGVLIPASVYLIDSGGANTQDVYNYGAARAHLGCIVIKGASRPNRPIISSVPSKVDIDWQGQRTEGGVQLWSIGTDVAKDHLYNRLQLVEGPGAHHMHSLLPADWFEQVVAERKVITYRHGFAKVTWVKANGDRNEALDLSVYNLAAAYHLGLHKWSAADWARLREKLIPKQLTPDLFALDAAQSPTPRAESPAEPVVAETSLPAAAQAAEPAASPAAPQPVAPAPIPSPVRPAPVGGRRILSRGLA